MPSIWTLLTITICLSIQNAKADLFEKLYSGFNKSDQVKEINLNRKVLINNFEIELNRYDWKFDLAGIYSDSNLQSLFSFQSQQTISTTYELGLSKSSFKYGTFTVKHSQTSYDISKWTGQTFSTYQSDKVYESKNSLSYSYEILNEFRRVEEKEILARKELEVANQSIVKEQTHYDFFVTYMNAKMRILLDQLTKEAKQSALERVKLLKRRVGDGLSRSVDLNTARLSVLTQEENLLKNESSLRESLAILEDILNISLPPSEYKRINWTFKEVTYFKSLIGESKFPELARLEALNKISKLNLLKLDAKQTHSLSLDLGYTINAVNTEREDAISDSMGGGENDEKIIALRYSIPLGFDSAKLVRSQNSFEQKRNDLRLKNETSELRVLNKVLSENIERYSKAVKILNQKVELARKIMRENQRLYLRGQVSFEEALRSEENLISTRISRVNMYALYEGTLARKAFIEGKILAFLSRYKD